MGVPCLHLYEAPSPRPQNSGQENKMKATDLCTRGVLEYVPLNFRYSHRDKVVKFLLRVKAIA